MKDFFKKERLRLKLSQAFIAEECDVSSRTVIRWEKGAAIPSDKLEILIRHGFDAQYILTGVRSTNMNQIEDDFESLDARVSRLDQNQQDAIYSMIDELEKAVDLKNKAKDWARQLIDK